MLEPNDVKRYERELRAMLRRAGDEDPEGFAEIAQLLYTAVDGLESAVLDMRRRGYSWRQIADALGVPVSTVHRRWGGTKPADALKPADPEVEA